MTYGYGEEISWDKLQTLAGEVMRWATAHGLDFKMSVTANYW